MKTILKYILKVGSVIMKILLFLLVILILAPVGYFAWRASQPMNMPEYDGRTYYSLLAERQQAYNELALSYQANHSNMDVKVGMCYQSELLMIAYNLPWGGFCSLAGVMPELKNMMGANAQRLGCGQDQGTLFTLLPNWWNMYERLTFDLLSHAVSGPVPYCRIPAP